jgi:hypothetical protein
VSTWQISPYYSTSWRKNISNFLGNDFFLLWFVPIAPTQSEDDGYYYEIYETGKGSPKMYKGNSDDSN